MKLLKKAAAMVLAATSVFTCASCGENTAYVMDVADFDVRAGIYLYYATSAYGEAVQVLREGGEEFTGAAESKDFKKILDKADIDQITANEWIQNKAEEYCKTFVAIEKEFDALDLKLTGEQLAAAENSAKTSMSYYGDFFNSAGIGEQSVKDIILNSYKQDAIWEAYYAVDGIKGIQEQELYDNYKENHFRFKYIEMPLKDGEGNLLKADGKKQIEEMANDYLKRLSKKTKSEAELMNEFDFLIEEHENYVTSLSNAAVTTTDENGSTITTETTAKLTTDKNGSTGTTAGEEDETTTADTTTATTTTAAAADEETEETTVSVTTETTDTTTTTTTTTATSYDTFNEKVYAVSTTASEKENDKADTTTTEPSYTPCEKVYNWASDESTPLLKPELIKDEECYYIVVKMDLEERMTSDDLWNESTQDSTLSSMYYQEFLDMINDMAKNLPSTRNQAAFRRYKVLDIDYIGYQQALMNSYTSMYGGY
ncbi:MAG: hypothetical protein MJ071_04585 [Oscillospiraceae bacterium]|nr:hypothetical protein [Oscillospiraceae bacterium]